MRFAIHEGFIRSKFDGTRRLIPFKALCHLYGLDPRSCVNWTKFGNTYPKKDYIHLFPLYNGNYKETLYEKRLTSEKPKKA